MGALREKIETYCNLKGIEIPPGFIRHTPSRYAIIKIEDGGWKLTAKTWFNVSDVINYLNNHCEGVEYRVLDFKEEAELKRRGEKQLEKCGNIQDVD